MKTPLALLLAVLLPLAAHGRGGDLDLTVNTLGVQQLFNSTDDAYVFARQPDGKFLHVHHDGDTITVTRRLKDGSLDALFGFGGAVTYPRATQVASPAVVVPLTVKAILLAPDGKIVLVGEATASCGTIGLARLRDDGFSDQSFGTNGWTATIPPVTPVGTCVDGAHFTLAAARLLSDGRIAAAGYPDDPLASRRTGTAIAVRWLANGALDPAFNGQGYVRPLFQWVDHPGGASIAENGAVEFVHAQQTAAPSPWVLASTRLSADGATRTDTPLAVPSDLRETPAVAFGPNGVRYVHSRATGDAGQAAVTRVKSDDSVDTAFGTGGRAAVTYPPNLRVIAAQALPDGGLLLWAGAVEPPNDALLAAKLDSTGTLEPSFGTAGRLALSTSPLSEFAHQVSSGTDGYVELFAFTLARVAGVQRLGWYFTRVQGVPDVVEFENTTLDHYFISYDGSEARGIDAGAAGAGWRRTGQAFRPGGASLVCRFYGTPGKGPNSHFYTPDPDECAAVKRDPGWTYEGLAFAVNAPTNFSCPSGQDAVHRLYNNRFAQNDSNHRFTTNDSLISSMVARGWKYEGVAWCVVR